MEILKLNYMNCLKKTLIKIGSLASPIPYILNKLQMTSSLLYTGTLIKKFAHFGENSVISYRALRLEGTDCISIGSDTVIRKYVQLTTWKTGNHKPFISIGNNCCIRENAHITSINKIIIGNNVLTGTNILISDNSHGDNSVQNMKVPPIKRTLYSKGEIKIDDNVWIGNNVCIFGNVHIGEGAIIGANAVVTKDIPPFSIAVGIPAKIIKKNDINIIKKHLKRYIKKKK